MKPGPKRPNRLNHPHPRSITKRPLALLNKPKFQFHAYSDDYSDVNTADLIDVSVKQRINLISDSYTYYSSSESISSPQQKIFESHHTSNSEESSTSSELESPNSNNNSSVKSENQANSHPIIAIPNKPTGHPRYIRKICRNSIQQQMPTDTNPSNNDQSEQNRNLQTSKSMRNFSVQNSKSIRSSHSLYSGSIDKQSHQDSEITLEMPQSETRMNEKIRNSVQLSTKQAIELTQNDQKSHNNQFERFTIIREYKPIKRLITKIYDDDSQLIFESKEKRHRNGKFFHIFSNTEQLTNRSGVFYSNPNTFLFDPETTLCYLESHKNDKEFILYTPYLKAERDDRRGELIAIRAESFLKIGESKSYSITAAIPSTQEPHFPVSNRAHLSSVAKKKQSNNMRTNISDDPFIKSMEIRLDSQMEQICVIPIEDQRILRLVELDFDANVEKEIGSAFYQKSVKNTILVNEKTNESIFIMYKSSSKSFSIRIRYPMLSYQAAAIAIAIFKQS